MKILIISFSIMSEGTQSQLFDYLVEHGYKSFPHSVRDKISVGTTTLEEALRVLPRQMFSALQNSK
jgi:type II secretory ATPase GspE/PulE/Tfp pilus assembly ATPase PilB-like protein